MKPWLPVFGWDFVHDQEKKTEVLVAKSSLRLLSYAADGEFDGFCYHTYTP